MHPVGRPRRQPALATWAVAALVAAAVVATVIGLVRQPETALPATPSPTPAASGSPAPDPAPSASSGASVPDVPRRDADLAAQPTPQDPVAPVHLDLPTLGVELPVDPVGVQADGQMEIPPQAERAGWYRFGPTPGAAQGTAVIAAHVDSVASAGLGPFARLKDLAPGDPADVALADGSVVAFQVDAVTSVPKSDVTWPDMFDSEGPSRLVLVTCGGTWDPDVRHYSNNVIVSLTPVATDGAP